MPNCRWESLPREATSLLTFVSRKIVSWLTGTCVGCREVDAVGHDLWPLDEEWMDAPEVHTEVIKESRYVCGEDAVRPYILNSATSVPQGGSAAVRSISTVSSEIRDDAGPYPRLSAQSRLSSTDARKSSTDARKSSTDARKSSTDAQKSSTYARKSSTDARKSSTDARKSSDAYPTGSACPTEEKVASPILPSVPAASSPRMSRSPKSKLHGESRRVRSFTDHTELSYVTVRETPVTSPTTGERRRTFGKHSPRNRGSTCKNSLSPRKNPSTSPRKRSLPCERKRTSGNEETDEYVMSSRVWSIPRPFVDARERSVSMVMSWPPKRASRVDPKILQLQQAMWGPKTDHLKSRSVSASHGAERDSSAPPTHGTYPSPRCGSIQRTRARLQTDPWAEPGASPRLEPTTPRIRLRTESWVGRRTVIEDEEIFVAPEREPSSGRSTCSQSSVEPPVSDGSHSGDIDGSQSVPRKRTMDSQWFVELQNFMRANTADSVMLHWERLRAHLDTGRNVDFPFKMLPKRPWQSQRLRQHLNVFVSKWRTKESRKRENHLQMLVIGGGPVGLRTAIAAAVNRYKVNVWEKRDSFSRINRLHLWDFVGRDLIELNAKLYDCEGSNFCADPDFMHIGIGNLQALLLKNALLLGIDVKFKCQYTGAEAMEKGWRVTSMDLRKHELQSLNTDILIGCDGCNSSVISLLGKYIKVELTNATGLVANFVNAGTSAPRQFSYARQYFVSIFKKLEDEFGPQLENIVYFRGNTNHYFVMTCTKKSLLQFGALNSDNVEVPTKLREYAKQVVKFFGMPEEELTFVEGTQACSIFDFSTTTRSELPITFHSNDTAAVALVGDALMEPFWPEGLGCIRGFLSGFDALAAIETWQMRGAAAAKEQALASYKNLKSINAASKDSVLRKDVSSYRIDPATRYCR